MYQLYTIPGSCSTGIHVLLNILDQPVTITKRDDVENYATMVPTNQVPALRDGEMLITEGAAIVLHLLEKHGVGLDEFGDEVEFKQWLMFNYATLHVAYSKLFSVNRLMEDSAQKQALMQALAAKVTDIWQIVENRLNGREFVVGEKATVIDYLMAIYVGWGNAFPDLQIPLGANVLRLVREVSNHEVFQRAFDVEGGQYRIPENAISGPKAA